MTTILYEVNFSEDASISIIIIFIIIIIIIIIFSTIIFVILFGIDIVIFIQLQ